MLAAVVFAFLLIAQPLAAQQLIVQSSTADVYYSGSYALLIGESNYSNGLASLPGVADDIEAVKNVFEKHGFDVIVKMNLTSEQFDNEMRNFISNFGQIQDARIVIYYAGHGSTRTIKTTEQQIGYIVPIDAPNPSYDFSGFLSKAISMNRFKEYAYTMEAKHVLFIFDACFAGTIFGSRGNQSTTINYLASKPVRQFITSGDAGETVSDYSYFRRLLVED